MKHKMTKEQKITKRLTTGEIKPLIEHFSPKFQPSREAIQNNRGEEILSAAEIDNLLKLTGLEPGESENRIRREERNKPFWNKKMSKKDRENPSEYVKPEPDNDISADSVDLKSTIKKAKKIRELLREYDNYITEHNSNKSYTTWLVDKVLSLQYELAFRGGVVVWCVVIFSVIWVLCGIIISGPK